MTWDDDRWREPSDRPWAAGCRWLQSRWRETELGLDPGPISPGQPDRLVASMLPLDASRSANFLSPEAHAAAEALLARGAGPGIVDEDRLLRNLLSSQPACVNLFGPFVLDPGGLTGWVRSLDPDCEAVTKVRLEWAPPREEHFGGGSAFDAFVQYRTATGTRFVGVETKYAEDLTASRITVRDVYRDYTAASEHWLEGAEVRLDRPSLRQFWLNTLLAQSLAKVGHDDTTYEAGLEVVVACAADESAALATHQVRVGLHDPDQWLRWVPYEDLLAHLDASVPWVEDFRRRYLDAAPVAHLLRPDDPRLSEPTVDLEGARHLLMVGRRVLGEGSVIGQIVDAFDAGRLDDADRRDLEVLDARAAELAEDLRALREFAYRVWSRIESS